MTPKVPLVKTPKTRTKSPAELRLDRLEAALHLARNARDLLREARARQSHPKAKRLVRSIEGAIRHAQRAL
jgi:hypothetical protein